MRGFPTGHARRSNRHFVHAEAGGAEHLRQGFVVASMVAADEQARLLDGGHLLRRPAFRLDLDIVRLLAAAAQQQAQPRSEVAVPEAADTVLPPWRPVEVPGRCQAPMRVEPLR